MKLFSNKEARPETITAWIEKENEDSTAWVALLNQSSTPVTSIILSTVNVQKIASSGKDTPDICRAYVRILPPGKYFARLLIHHGMSFISGVEIAYTDIKGRHWIRNGNGSLSRIKKSPVTYYNLLLPLSWEMPQPVINND